MRLTRKEVLDKLPPKTREEIDRENRASELTFEYASKSAREALSELAPSVFVQAARTETMLRDFQRLREAIRAHDSEATEAAWEKCERWIPLPKSAQSDQTP
jgi:acetyl esterase/lipase